MIVGLIPAAGHGRRMGRPKLGLMVGGRTLLECVVAALRGGGADVVLVVLGPHVADLEGLAERAGAMVLLLDEPTPDMRATVERGLDWLERWRPMTDADSLLLSPADHPTLDAGLVRGLIMARGEDDILIPTHHGKRGHPALIGWRHVAGIRAHPAGEGLNAYLRGRRITEIAAGPEALIDIDTPEDYERLLAGLARSASEEGQP